MENMLVDQQYIRPPLRPFDLELASSSLTPEEKAILQARVQLLGFRSPFPHHSQMGIPMSSAGFSPFPSPPGGGSMCSPSTSSPCPSSSSSQSSRFSEAAAAAAAANALNINGSLSHLYAMAAANSNSSNSPGSSSSPSSMGPRHPSNGMPPGGGNSQMPLPIQLWTQWASLQGLSPLAPTIWAHQAQLAAVMAASAANSGGNGNHTFTSSSAGIPSGCSLPGEGGANSLRLPKPIYPGNSGVNRNATSPHMGAASHRFSPYTIPSMNNTKNRSNHSGSASNKSSSPMGSPDSLRDEVIS